MASYLATNYRVGDGSTTIWNVSFAGARPDQGGGTEAYLDPDSVKAVTITENPDGSETETPLIGTLLSPTQFEITPAVASGVRFKVYRETNKQYPLVDFTDFAALSEAELDASFRQTLYAVQEIQDVVTYSDARSVEARQLAQTAADDSSTALTTAQAADSKATTAQTQAAAANTAAQGAQTAATNAANSATAAQNSAAQAASDARDAQDTADGAVQTANTANATASTALNTADNALNVATTARNTADSATSTANTALSTANTATSNASQAVTTANSASDDAESALTTANAANLTAQSASDTANTANSNATTAINTANSAASDASTALSTANTALSTANTADGKADTAISTANSAQSTADAAASDASTALSTANAAASDAADAVAVADDVQTFQAELDDLSYRVDQLSGGDTSDLMLGSNNLSDVNDAIVARSNLDVLSTSEVSSAVGQGIADHEAAADPHPQYLTAEEVGGAAAYDVGIATGELTTNSRVTSVVNNAVTAHTNASNPHPQYALTSGLGEAASYNVGSASGELTTNAQATTISSASAANAVSTHEGATDPHPQYLRESELPTATTNTAGIVQLSDSTGSTSSAVAATAKAVSSAVASASQALATHKTSGDHDSRYYTKTEIDARKELVGGYTRTPVNQALYFQVPKTIVQTTGTGNTKVSWTDLAQDTYFSGHDTSWWYPDSLFDRTNHEFVAPIAGMYYFFAQLMRRPNNDQAANFGFMKNGVRMDGSGSQPGGPQGFAPGGADLNGGNTYTSARIEVYIYMNAGDRMAVYQAGQVTIHANTSGTVPSWFGGHIL